MAVAAPTAARLTPHLFVVQTLIALRTSIQPLSVVTQQVREVLAQHALPFLIAEVLSRASIPALLQLARTGASYQPAFVRAPKLANL